MKLNIKRVVIVLASILMTFVTLRIYLYLFPNANFDVGDYNIHHLFTELLLVVIGGLPLVFFEGHSRKLDVAAVVFGMGLSMAFDEWVYLIATDGSDASYLLPISFWGAGVMMALIFGYAFLLLAVSHGCKRINKADE